MSVYCCACETVGPVQAHLVCALHCCQLLQQTSGKQVVWNHDAVLCAPCHCSSRIAELLSYTARHPSVQRSTHTIESVIVEWLTSTYLTVSADVDIGFCAKANVCWKSNAYCIFSAARCAITVHYIFTISKLRRKPMLFAWTAFSHRNGMWTEQVIDLLRTLERRCGYLYRLRHR